MALYVSAGRRRRRLYLTAGVSALVALIIGVGLGRATAPKPLDQARDAKETAKVVTGQLRALPLHYEQVSRGELDRDTFGASLEAGLRRARSDLDVAMDQAVWLDPLVRQALIDGIAEIKATADRRGAPQEFDAAVRRETERIDAAFGAASAPTP